MITTATMAAKTLRDAAHELNNLCATIIGFAALAEESEAEATVAGAYLKEIQISAEAVAAVAKQLRALSEDLQAAK